jgi:hypothetical protein
VHLPWSLDVLMHDAPRPDDGCRERVRDDDDYVITV